MSNSDKAKAKGAEAKAKDAGKRIKLQCTIIGTSKLTKKQEDELVKQGLAKWEK